MSLKGLFFKEDVKPVQEPISDGTKPQPQVTTQVTQPQFIPNISGVADDKFMAMLNSVIEENNLPGQDYFEFSKSLESMSSIPMDERTKFMSVYAILSNQGCSKQILLDSIDKYIICIKNEESNFTKELGIEYENNVGVKKNTVDNAKKRIEELSNELISLNDLISTTTKEIQTEENRLAIIDSNFKKTVSIKLDQLNSDKTKITTYIPQPI